MQQKISLIIVTDFVCWIPFIIVCCLHDLEILDATRWYALFSIVVLPINSVINPVLCDDKITSIVNIFTSRISTYLRMRITNLLSTCVDEYPCQAANEPCCSHEIREVVTKKITYMEQPSTSKSNVTIMYPETLCWGLNNWLLNGNHRTIEQPYSSESI